MRNGVNRQRCRILRQLLKRCLSVWRISILQGTVRNANALSQKTSLMYEQIVRRQDMSRMLKAWKVHTQHELQLQDIKKMAENTVFEDKKRRAMLFWIRRGMKMTFYAWKDTIASTLRARSLASRALAFYVEASRKAVFTAWRNEALTNARIVRLGNKLAIKIMRKLMVRILIHWNTASARQAQAMYLLKK